jgi:hypothetical protein
MQIRKSANTVAEHLFAAEAAIDEAIRCAAALAGALPAARLESGLSATVGQEAFSGAGRAIATLTDARAELVRTHGALATVRDGVGLRNIAFGGGDKEDPTQPPLFAQLSVVSDTRKQA